jgi:flagellar hook assembly protein FlgD
VYTLPQNAHVKVTIYDIRGRTMAVLTNSYQSAGYYTIKWNASAFSSGVDFIILLFL